MADGSRSERDASIECFASTTVLRVNTVEACLRLPRTGRAWQEADRGSRRRSRHLGRGCARRHVVRPHAQLEAAIRSRLRMFRRWASSARCWMYLYDSKTERVPVKRPSLVTTAGYFAASFSFGIALMHSPADCREAAPPARTSRVLAVGCGGTRPLRPAGRALTRDPPSLRHAGWLDLLNEARNSGVISDARSVRTMDVRGSYRMVPFMPFGKKPPPVGTPS